METIQFYPSRWGQETIQAQSEKIVIHRKDLFQESQVEFDYSELDSKVMTGKAGEQGWSNVALFVFILVIPVDILWRYFTGSGMNWFIVGIPLILAGIIFSLRFIKKDYVAFYTLQREFAFALWLAGKDRSARESMVKYLLEKIEQKKILAGSVGSYSERRSSV